jgi:hypothetical protein
VVQHHTWTTRERGNSVSGGLLSGCDELLVLGALRGGADELATLPDVGVNKRHQGGDPRERRSERHSSKAEEGGQEHRGTHPTDQLHDPRKSRH